MQQSLWSYTPTRDLSEGERLKRDGIRIVLDNQGNSWSEMAQHLIAHYIKRHGPCLMEDARVFALECGLPEPSHPNAWGAVSSGLSRKGQIEMTGDRSKSKSVKSHARIQPMWVAK